MDGRSTLQTIFAASLVLFAACSRDRSATAPPPTFSVAGTVGVQTLPGIYFLPPLADAPSAYSGTFDPSLSPVVEIVDGTAAVVERFTTAGTGSSAVRVSGEQYLVNWQNGTGDAYRVRLLVNGAVLGSVAVPAGRRTWPIKFRIEQGASTLVLNKVAGDSQTASTGAAVPVAPSVRLTNARGDVIGGYTISFAVVAGGGSVTGATPTTDATGLATLGGWALGPTPGLNTLTATAAGATASFDAQAISCATVQTIAVNDFVMPLQSGLVLNLNATTGQTFFQGTQVMYAGGVLYGSSPADVLVAFDADYGKSSLTHGPVCVDRVTPYHHTVASLVPAAAGTAPAGLTVTQESFAYPSAPDNGYVLLKYTFSNTGTAPIANFYSGWLADWDILFDGPTGYGTDRVRYNAALGLGEATEGDTVRYQEIVGIVPVGPSGTFSFHGYCNGCVPAATMATYFGFLSGGINLTLPTGPSDIREMMGLAPLTLAPGESTLAYFALVGGANRTAWEANVAAARAKAVALGF